MSYLLASDKIIKREYGNLEKIKDSYPKFVISFDDVQFPSKEGIKHIKAWELDGYF